MFDCIQDLERKHFLRAHEWNENIFRERAFTVFMALMHLAVECGLQSDLSDIALPAQAGEPYIAVECRHSCGELNALALVSPIAAILWHRQR